MRLKKVTVRILIVSIMVMLMLSSTTFAGAPQNIFYENAENKVVKVDYVAALNAKIDGNATMLDAFKAKMTEAILNGKNIYVEDDAGKVINYTNAIAAGKTYVDAISSASYVAAKPEAQKELSSTGIEVDTTSPGSSDLEVISID